MGVAVTAIMNLESSFFASTKTVTSVTVEGVSFTIKRLTMPERASLELDTAEALAKQQELALEFREIRDELKATVPLDSDSDEANIPLEHLLDWQQRQDASRVEGAPDKTMRAKITRLLLQKDRTNMTFATLSSAKIQPAWIKAGLASITGITVDGKPITKEQLIAHGPQELADEIFSAIRAEAYLDPAAQKNSQSPTSSLPLEGQATTNSTAQNASGKDGTLDAIAAASSQAQ